MWFTKEIQDVLKEYDSNEATGLSSQEVKLRLEKYGENKLKSKPKKSFFQLILPDTTNTIYSIIQLFMPTVLKRQL